MAAVGFPTIPTPEEEEDNREGLPKESSQHHSTSTFYKDWILSTSQVNQKEKLVFFKTNKSVFFKTKTCQDLSRETQKKDGSFERKRRSQDGLHHEDRPTSTAG